MKSKLRDLNAICRVGGSLPLLLKLLSFVLGSGRWGWGWGCGEGLC